MRIYIAGCGGMLGEAVHRIFSQKFQLKCTDIVTVEPWLEFCDFRDKASYLDSVRSFDADVLVHLGAHTDLEYCEQNAGDAYATNTLAVENAADIARKLNLKLVYISTAGIFDGLKGVYDDWDTPNPLSVYGRSKYLGEQVVAASGLRYFICRAGWMMGGGPIKDKKFVGKLIRQVDAGVTELNIVGDKQGTPTYTVDFARNLLVLLSTDHYGLYNMVCGGETSRIEVARELLRLLGADKRIRINEVGSDFFAREYFAPRPPSERLINYKLSLRGLNNMRDWRIALAEYLKDYYGEATSRPLSDASA